MLILFITASTWQ